MDIATTIIVSVACTILGAIAADIYIRIKARTKKAIEKRKKERQEEFKDSILPCITDAIKPLSEKIDSLEVEIKSVKDTDLPILKRANRDSLRNQLFASFRHCDKVGYRTIEDTQS